MKTLIENFTQKLQGDFQFGEVLEVSILKPITVNRIRVITMLGKVVHIICPICPNKSVPATAGARLVVSDRGDILSPKYEPEIIAPAVISETFLTLLPLQSMQSQQFQRLSKSYRSTKLLTHRYAAC